MKNEKQIASVEVTQSGNYTELEKPFGYLTENDNNYITCLDVRFKTQLSIEEVKEKIKKRDYLMITLITESIVLLTTKELKK